MLLNEQVQFKKKKHTCEFGVAMANVTHIVVRIQVLVPFLVEHVLFAGAHKHHRSIVEGVQRRTARDHADHESAPQRKFHSRATIPKKKKNGGGGLHDHAHKIADTPHELLANASHLYLPNSLVLFLALGLPISQHRGGTY